MKITNLYNKIQSILLFLFLIILFDSCSSTDMKRNDSGQMKTSQFLDLKKRTFILPVSAYSIQLFRELNKEKKGSDQFSACIEFNSESKKSRISFPWHEKSFQLDIKPRPKNLRDFQSANKMSKEPEIISIFDTGEFSIGIYQVSNYGIYSFSLKEHGIPYEKSFEECSDLPIRIKEECRTSPDEKYLMVTARSGLKLREKPSREANVLELVPYNEMIIYVISNITYVKNEGKKPLYESWLKVSRNGKEGYLYMNYLSKYPICYSDSISLEKLHTTLYTFSSVPIDLGGITLTNQFFKGQLVPVCRTNMDGYGSCIVHRYEIKNDRVIFEYGMIGKEFSPDLQYCEIEKDQFLRFSPFHSTKISPEMCKTIK